MELIGFFFGCIVYIIFSFFAGTITENSGRSKFWFFVISIVLSPVLRIISALLVKENIEVLEETSIFNGTHKRCPKCAEVIKGKAIICKHCGAESIAIEAIPLVVPETNPPVAITRELLKPQSFWKWR